MKRIPPGRSWSSRFRDQRIGGISSRQGQKWSLRYRDWGTKVNQNVEVENEPRNDKAEIDEVEHPTPSANDSQYQKNINKAHQSLPEEFKKDPTRDPNNWLYQGKVLPTDKWESKKLKP